MWARRLLWTLALWSAGVLTVGAVAVAIRILMNLAGLTS
jgi:hypothetical protein